MREILFRAKRKDNGEWVYGVPITSGNMAVMYYPAIVCVCEQTVDINTIGQFTGLTDKNGTKIFEGDILELLHKEQRDIRSVIWYNKFMSYELATNGKVDRHDGWDFTDCCYSGVVIGNIFDNKELLQ